MYRNSSHDRRWAAVIVACALVLVGLYFFAISSSCSAKDGHLSWSLFRRDVLCLTDDGRVVDVP